MIITGKKKNIDASVNRSKFSELLDCQSLPQMLWNKKQPTKIQAHLSGWDLKWKSFFFFLQRGTCFESKLWPTRTFNSTHRYQSRPSSSKSLLTSHHWKEHDLSKSDTWNRMGPGGTRRESDTSPTQLVIFLMFPDSCLCLSAMKWTRSEHRKGLKQPLTREQGRRLVMPLDGSIEQQKSNYSFRSWTWTGWDGNMSVRMCMRRKKSELLMRMTVYFNNIMSSCDC